VNDTKIEGAETVILTLAADAAYTAGTPSVGTVTIADNDQISSSLVIAPMCSGSSSEATITWPSSSLGSLGYFIIIDTDADADNGFWSKSIPAGVTSTVAPAGFLPYLFPSSLIFTEGSPYTITLFYVSNGSAILNTFTAATCPGSPPPPPPPPTLSSILIKRVGDDTLTTASAPATEAVVDVFPSTSANPATFTGLSVGTHTISVTDVASYTETAGTCAYAEPIALPTEGCSVSSFPMTPACNGSTCTLTLTTTANMVTKIVFVYTDVAPPPPPPPGTPPPPPSSTPPGGGGGSQSTGPTSEPPPPPSPGSLIAPTNLSATPVSSTKIYITWTTGSSGIGLKLESSTNGITFSEIATMPPYHYYWSAINLTSNTKYYYRVRAYDASGSVSAYSNVASANTLSAGGVLFTKGLYLGMTDPEVNSMQACLAKTPAVYPQGIVSGYFGSLTESAVKKFQTQYGISPIGIVGPATRAKLNEVCGGNVPPPPPVVASGSFTKLLAPGTTDSEVSLLQTLLAKNPMLYPAGIVSGYFGSLTEAAMKQFQAKYGISPVGFVGPQTRMKLNEISASGQMP
jgi:peptidoglycan hydrolase-like protein with peptidoglycan-binding domain